MRRIQLFIIIFFVFGTTADCQVRYGFSAGLNCSTITFSSPNNYVWGFSMSIICEVRLGQSFYLSPGLSFITKGNSLTNENVFRLQYLVLPVLAGYHISKRLDLMAGPQAGLLLNARIYPFNIMNQLRSFEFEYLAGLKYSFSQKAGVDFSFSRSIWGIFNSSQSMSGSDEFTLAEKDNPKNQTFQIAFYYLLN